MQKNILYLLLLVIVGAGVYYLVLDKKENAFGKTEAAFTIKDTGSIGRIFLVRTSGESIKLTRTDSGWILNDTYKAHKSTLFGLLRTLRTQEAQSPVAESDHNSIIKSLAGSSVKVEIYDLEGEKIRVFYVGGASYDYGGTFMLLDGAKRAYQVKIPGFQGILMPYYNTDLADWRDRHVFSLGPDEIKTVKVEYPQEPLNSFTVQSDSKLSVDIDAAVRGGKPLNEKRTKAYLGFFQNVNCEGFLMGVSGIDTILTSVPKICIIDITSKRGINQHVEIYRMPITKRSKNINIDEDLYDVDRFYAVMNNFQDTAIIQKYSFENIWRRGFEFYEEETPANIMGIKGTSN